MNQNIIADDDEYNDIRDQEIINYGPSVAETGWVPKLFENNYRTTQLVFTKRNGKTLAHLRKPRDLYALRKLTNLSNVRWPCELQVQPRRPFHIIYTPSKAEPLWKKEILEKAEIENVEKSANVHGKVVYDNCSDPEVKYFIASKTYSRATPPKPYYILKDSADKTLLFESRFECGNLMRAVKVGEYDYQLWLKFDLYTKKNTQWFYFKMQNAHPNITYRFTIMNFLKSGSLYSEGMKPLMYSEKDALEKGIGWVRVGSAIKYYENDIRVEDNKERCYYSLHWKCTFPNEKDTYYFAYSYPYTYSDLQEYLSYLSSDPHRRKYCKQRILCQTQAGNHIYVLTITSPTKCPKQAKMKKVIVITARVHPGETIASWMMKGLLDFLTSDEPDAKILRETFIFKIIPMLNPDGVIVGNYRCSLAGRDLNRHYQSDLKDSFPSVWMTKLLVKKLQEEREVVLYCDFHGHSRKKDIFIYGCEEKHDKTNARLHSRIFPLILSKNAPDKFSFSGCRFKVHKSKEGTGRVVMWSMGIRYSYTLEASFCGSSSPNGRDNHFGVQDYEAMGYHFCDSLLDLFDPDTSKFLKLRNEIEKQLYSAVLSKMISTCELVEEEMDISHLEYISDIESESFGSDSSVSDGLPMKLIHAPIPKITKKKRLKSRKERNRNRKQKLHSNSLVTKETRLGHAVSSGDLSPIKSQKKSHPKHSSSLLGKISYTSCMKGKSPHRHRNSYRITGTNDYLDNLTYSYVQANLIGGSLKDHDEQCTTNSSSPRERYNPAYRLSLDASDTEADIQISNKSAYMNPTLEVARCITDYNYRSSKIPPRMNKMFAIWSANDQNIEELMKRRTVNQGDNFEYLKKKLADCHLEKRNTPTKILSQKNRFTSSASCHPLISISTTATEIKLSKSNVTQNTRSKPKQRLRHTNSLALRSRTQKLPNHLLTRRKYLPKLQGNIAMQPDPNDHSGFLLSTLSRSFDGKLLQTKLTDTMKNNRTHARKELLRSLENVCIDGKSDKESKLAQRLIGYRDSGSLYSDMESKDRFGNLTGSLMKNRSDPLSMEEDVISASSSGRPSTPVSYFRVADKRAVTPQQYCMHLNENLTLPLSTKNEECYLDSENRNDSFTILNSRRKFLSLF